MELDICYSGLLLQTMYHIEPITNFAAALFVTIILLCFVSILAATELALTSLSQEETDEIEENKSKKYKIVAAMADCPRLVQASFRIVHCIVLIAVNISFMFAINCLYLPVNNTVIYLTAFVVIFILWLAFYAIIPKTIKINELRFALFNATLINAVINVATPLLKLSRTQIETPEYEQSKKTQMPLADEAPSDIYEEKEMLEEIIHFYNKTAKEIMTPRTDIEAIDIKSGFREMIDIIVKSGYSRIPVYEENEDNIKGVLYAKDIIPAFNKDDTTEWQKLIRKPYFVPESKKIDDLLDEFRENKIHLAVVVDEFGATAGLVTMEDIIEEIVGDISDEYDEDNHSIISLPDGGFILEGKIQLNDFFRETDVSASDFGEHTEEAETLTGLLLAIKGSLPKRRDIIQYKNYSFTILEADERRVMKVKLNIQPQPEEKDD